MEETAGQLQRLYHSPKEAGGTREASERKLDQSTRPVCAYSRQGRAGQWNEGQTIGRQCTHRTGATCEGLVEQADIQAVLNEHYELLGMLGARRNDGRAIEKDRIQMLRLCGHLGMHAG